MTREFLPSSNKILLAERRRREGRLAEATGLCREWLVAQPNSYEAEYLLGLMAGTEGQFVEAVEHLRRAATLAPELAFVHAALGEMYWFAGNLDAAAEASSRALALSPHYPEALNNLSRVALARGDQQQALDYCQEAIALRPDFAEAHDNLGAVLSETGRLALAEKACEKAVQINPDNSIFWANFANLHRFVPEDPRLATMVKLRAKPGISDTDRLHLDFALGKAYSDVADYRRSFEHFNAGNTAKRARIGYNEQAALGLFDNIERIFSPELMAAKAGHGDPSTLPIFIVGMPRSGSTLVEQILASHPDVHGGGEIGTLQAAVQATRTPDGQPILGPRFVPALEGRTFNEIGTRYVAELRKLAPDATHVTDKLLPNFFFIGLITLALPRARIIHVVRNPVDTCVSCFSTLFNGEINYAYDLGELGRYYRRYERLMAHWKNLLPPEHMLEIGYEDVVADIEGETRKMLSYCDLDWNPQCIDFYKTDRPVRTASATQVRQPLYNKSVGRWRAYESYIAPLLSELNR